MWRVKRERPTVKKAQRKFRLCQSGTSHGERSGLGCGPTRGKPFELKVDKDAFALDVSSQKRVLLLTVVGDVGCVVVGQEGAAALLVQSLCSTTTPFVAVWSVMCARPTWARD